MRVGFIGVGRIGGNLARLVAAGGHEVLLSANDPAGPNRMVDEIAGTSQATTPLDAIEAADIVVLAVGWQAFPDIAREYGTALRGTIVIDPSNPYTERNGRTVRLPIPDRLTSPQHQLRRLGEVRLVRTFGDRRGPDLLADGRAGQAGRRTDMRYWSDDADAAATVVPLIHDAGFDPVDGGGLAESRNIGQA